MADHVHHRSLADLIQTFTDFLIVSIHTILNSRALYPPSTFIMTRKYNVAVPQQRHPKVCAQIMTACSAVKTQLFEGVVRRVVFVIHQDAEVIERWIFDVDLFPVVPKDEASITMPELAVSLVDIEEQLRATMKRLAGCGAKLAPLPEDCTFTIMVELKDGADPPLGQSQAWVTSEPNLRTGEQMTRPAIGADLGIVRRMPVRFVEAGNFILETWVEWLEKHDDG